MEDFDIKGFISYLEKGKIINSMMEDVAYMFPPVGDKIAVFHKKDPQGGAYRVHTDSPTTALVRRQDAEAKIEEITTLLLKQDNHQSEVIQKIDAQNQELINENKRLRKLLDKAVSELEKDDNEWDEEFSKLEEDYSELEKELKQVKEDRETLFYKLSLSERRLNEISEIYDRMVKESNLVEKEIISITYEDFAQKVKEAIESDKTFPHEEFMERLRNKLVDKDDGWVYRKDSSMPYQNWKPFEDGQMVEVSNMYGPSLKGLAETFWWGYETYGGGIAESVIIKARKV